MAANREQERGGVEPLAHFLGWFSLGLGLAELFAPGGVARLIGAPERKGLIRTMGLREITSGLGIFAKRRPAGAVWSRVAGDAMDLAFLGASFASPAADKRRLTMATASVLGITALDGYCAQQLSGELDRAARIQSITINRPTEEVYQFWRNFENLPRFMAHLESVRVTGDTTSHWVVKAPAGMTVEWDAEITADRPGELIAWRSLEDADVPNSGTVHFIPAPGGRGTEVHVQIEYRPPAGQLGAAVAKLFGEEPGQQIKGDLYRFKQVLETGEVVHSDASIHKGPHPGQPSEGNVIQIREVA